MTRYSDHFKSKQHSPNPLVGNTSSLSFFF